jgi:hypothetical protein
MLRLGDAVIGGTAVCIKEIMLPEKFLKIRTIFTGFYLATFISVYQGKCVDCPFII